MEWKRFVASLVLAASLVAPSAAFARRHRGGSSYEAGKTEQVRGYTTKKGKHVKAHKRHPSGAAPHHKKKKR